MNSRPGKAPKGFTLLEVLIALVILGVSLGVIFQLLAQSKRISMKSDETFEAVRIMNNLMGDPRLMARAQEEGELEGELEGAPGSAPKWQYRFTLEPSVIIETAEGQEAYETEALGRITLRLTRLRATGEKTFTASRWLASGLEPENKR